MSPSKPEQPSERLRQRDVSMEIAAKLNENMETMLLLAAEARTSSKALENISSITLSQHQRLVKWRELFQVVKKLYMESRDTMSLMEHEANKDQQ